jgi:hypothetical protein
VSQQQGLGDVPLIGKKDIATFKADFQSNLAKDPATALNMFNRALSQAGDSYEGENSYRRALATDLADKDPNMAFLIPMADADPPMQAQMILNASKFETIQKEYGLSDKKLNEAFESLPLSTFESLRGTSMYGGLKQALFHQAAVEFQTNGNARDSLKIAHDKFSEMYTTVRTRDGRSSIMALNKAGGVNYNDKLPQLDRGMTKAVSLPMLNHAEKVELLVRYGKSGAVTSKTPSEHVDLLLKNLVRVEPSPRWPNTQTLMIGSQPVKKSDGTVVRLRMDELVKYGDEELAKEAKNNDRFKVQYPNRGGL